MRRIPFDGLTQPVSSRLAADPANVWARRSVGYAWKKIGETLARLRRPAESLEAHLSALAASSR